MALELAGNQLGGVPDYLRRFVDDNLSHHLHDSSFDA